MKAILFRATGEKVEVNVPPPAPKTVTYQHPSDSMRLQVFEIIGQGGQPHFAWYRERA